MAEWKFTSSLFNMSFHGLSTTPKYLEATIKQKYKEQFNSKQGSRSSWIISHDLCEFV